MGKRVKDADRLLKDAYWGREVKIKAGHRCEYDNCRKMKGLQAHHIFTRSNASVRHYIPNGCALCRGHHKFFAHLKPHEFREWIIGKRGQAWWNDLQDKANTRKVRYA